MDWPNSPVSRKVPGSASAAMRSRAFRTPCCLRSASLRSPPIARAFARRASKSARCFSNAIAVVLLALFLDQVRQGLGGLLPEGALACELGLELLRLAPGRLGARAVDACGHLRVAHDLARRRGQSVDDGLGCAGRRH